MRVYSGNTEESHSAILGLLEDDLAQHPTGDLVGIVREVGVNGRQGVEIAKCRRCGVQGTFQKVVEHITGFHWEVQLWTCTTEGW